MSQFEALSVEELSKLIQELQEVRRKKQGRPTKADLALMFDPNSSDFMGLGLSLNEFLLSQEIEALKRSYRNQTREEKSRRRDAAVALAVEYDRVRQQTTQATVFAREAIIHVVEGEWQDLKICRDMLTFEDDFVGSREIHAPIFARFVEMLDAVLAGVPRESPADSTQTVPS
jgi:hypothetical protein